DVDAHGSGATVPKRADLQPERVQVDEAFGVALPVDGVGLERGEVHPIEGSRRTAAGDRGDALVELEPHGPGDVARALVHEGLEQLALRCEPEAVVDHLRVT